MLSFEELHLALAEGKEGFGAGFDFAVADAGFSEDFVEVVAVLVEGVELCLFLDVFLGEFVDFFEELEFLVFLALDFVGEAGGEFPQLIQYLYILLWICA